MCDRSIITDSIDSTNSTKSSGPDALPRQMERLWGWKRRNLGTRRPVCVRIPFQLYTRCWSQSYPQRCAGDSWSLLGNNWRKTDPDNRREETWAPIRWCEGNCRQKTRQQGQEIWRPRQWWRLRRVGWGWVRRVEASHTGERELGRTCGWGGNRWAWRWESAVGLFVMAWKGQGRPLHS